MSDSLMNFTNAMDGFDAVVAQVDPDAWDNASPCSEWTARGVLEHVVGVTNMIAGAIRPDDDPASNHADSPAAKWAAARDGLMDALATPGVLERVSATPFGEMSIDQFIAMATFDPLTHTWDLAQAVGVDPQLDEDVVAAVMAHLEPMEDMLRGTGRFGPKVEAPADADIVTRYIAFSGRQPC